MTDKYFRKRLSERECVCICRAYMQCLIGYDLSFCPFLVWILDLQRGRMLLYPLIKHKEEGGRIQ